MGQKVNSKGEGMMPARKRKRGNDSNTKEPVSDVGATNVPKLKLTDLNVDVLYLIANFLDFCSVMMLRQVCKKLDEVFGQRYLDGMFRRIYSNSPADCQLVDRSDVIVRIRDWFVCGDIDPKFRQMTCGYVQGGSLRLANQALSFALNEYLQRFFRQEMGADRVLPENFKEAVVKALVPASCFVLTTMPFERYFCYLITLVANAILVKDVKGKVPRLPYFVKQRWGSDGCEIVYEAGKVSCEIIMDEIDFRLLMPALRLLAKERPRLTMGNFPGTHGFSIGMFADHDCLFNHALKTLFLDKNAKANRQALLEKSVVDQQFLIVNDWDAKDQYSCFSLLLYYPSLLKVLLVSWLAVANSDAKEVIKDNLWGSLLSKITYVGLVPFFVDKMGVPFPGGRLTLHAGFKRDWLNTPAKELAHLINEMRQSSSHAHAAKLATLSAVLSLRSRQGIADWIEGLTKETALCLLTEDCSMLSGWFERLSQLGFGDDYMGFDDDSMMFDNFRDYDSRELPDSKFQIFNVLLKYAVTDVILLEKLICKLLSFVEKEELEPVNIPFAKLVEVIGSVGEMTNKHVVRTYMTMFKVLQAFYLKSPSSAGVIDVMKKLQRLFVSAATLDIVEPLKLLCDSYFQIIYDDQCSALHKDFLLELFAQLGSPGRFELHAFVGIFQFILSDYSSDDRDSLYAKLAEHQDWLFKSARIMLKVNCGLLLFLCSPAPASVSTMFSAMAPVTGLTFTPELLGLFFSGDVKVNFECMLNLALTNAEVYAPFFICFLNQANGRACERFVDLCLQYEKIKESVCKLLCESEGDALKLNRKAEKGLSAVAKDALSNAIRDGKLSMAPLSTMRRAF